MSDEEIASGRRWRDEVGSALSEMDFGIICLTRDNQHNPWLMFEAGALAKNLMFGRVIPLCIGLDAAEVTGPLADFQGRRLDKDGMWKIIQDINAVATKVKAADRLTKLFDLTWPSLEKVVTDAMQASPEPAQLKRTVEDMLEELVDRVRRLERPFGPRIPSGDPPRKSVAVGDTVTLPDGRTAFVPTEFEAQKLSIMLELAAAGIDVSPVPIAQPVVRPGTVRTRASFGGAAVTTSSASGTLGEEPPEKSEDDDGEAGVAAIRKRAEYPRRRTSGVRCTPLERRMRSLQVRNFDEEDRDAFEAGPSAEVRPNAVPMAL